MDLAIATTQPPQIIIGLVQINNSFSGQNYLPYSTACLESYARQHSNKKDLLHFLPHVYKRTSIGQIVQSLESAQVVGFSTYVWNEQISLEIARRLKKQDPAKLIVFGGPQVPDEPEDFLLEHTFVDIVVHNEGEKTFTNIIDMYPNCDWDSLTGVSYLDDKGAIVRTMPTARMRDLSELPSPFFNGILDELVLQNPEEKWIGLWETNRGCPFRCTFCDWGSATAAKVTKFEDLRLQKEIDWMARNEIEYIFVCDANFGIQKRDVEIAEYVAKVKNATGFPQGFSVQNTKNATERAYTTQKIIAEAGLNKGVALSMQSLDPETLKNIKRDNISLDTYWELARRFTKDKIETYTDLILPLPGETYESFCKGVDELVRAGQHNRIQFNNLSILPNAEMGSKDYLEKHGMVVKTSEIINIHGSKVVLEDDVPEYQKLVVATNTMDSNSWRRARMFAWMSSFLYFDKIFQIPIMLAMETSNVEFSSIVRGFLDVDGNEFPVLTKIKKFFLSEAKRIEQGGAEYAFSEDWLGIYWPADEYAYIDLTDKKEIDQFFSEASEITRRIIRQQVKAEMHPAFEEALKLNRKLVSQPFEKGQIEIELSYNIIEFWRGLLEGEDVPLKHQSNTLVIDRDSQHYSDFDEWCQKVVWWGNKKGAYLYSAKSEDHPGQVKPVQSQLAGHF